MVLRDSQTSAYRGSTRKGPSRFTIAGFAGIALCFMLLDRAEAYVFEQAREAVTDFTAPIFEFLSPPVKSVRSFFGRVGDVVNIYDENKELKEENARLLAWKDAALRFERQNARYEALLNVRIDPGIDYITGRVVTDSGGPFVRTLVVNVGRRDLVQDGQAVIDEYGLVGRIWGAGRTASRVLLLTDLNSRVPILVEPSNYRGVLAGDNRVRPRLEFLPKQAQVNVGDRVVTSGHGGLLPPDIPIGFISEIKDDQIRVQMYSHRDRVDQVRILNFDFPRIVDVPEKVAATASETNAALTAQAN